MEPGAFAGTHSSSFCLLVYMLGADHCSVWVMPRREMCQKTVVWVAVYLDREEKAIKLFLTTCFFSFWKSQQVRAFPSCQLLEKIAFKMFSKADFILRFVLQLVTVEWFSRRISLLPAPHVFIHLLSSRA